MRTYSYILAASAVSLLNFGLASAQTTYPVLTVGNGTAASCTESALRSVVDTANATKGRQDIKFKCGTTPITIKLNKQLIVTDDTVFDGGNLITLDGQSRTRHILVMRSSDVTKTDAKNTFVMAKRPDGTAILLGVKNMGFINGRAGAIPSSIKVDGGSIHMGMYGKLVVERAVFKNNTTPGQVSNGRTASDVTYFGGAIHAGNNSVNYINKSIFENNTASNDGGAVNFGSFSSNKIEGSIFRNNTSKFVGIGGGGAVRAQSQTDTTILTSQFEGNKAMIGGAVFNMLSALTIKNSTFKNNTIEKKQIDTTSAEWNRIKNTNMKEMNPNGGAVYSDGVNKVNVAGNATFENNVFESNIIIGGEGKGGGVNICLYDNQTALFNGNKFNYNKATSYGGGFRVACGGFVTVKYNSFVKNITTATESWIQSTKHYHIDDKVKSSVSNNTLVN